MKTFILLSIVFLTGNSSYSQKLPYPIIFIHGLNSSSETWYEMGNYLLSEPYNLSYGGTMHFCLNDDGNDYVANKDVYPVSNADIAYYIDNADPVVVGDFYLINFDINHLGVVYPSNDEDDLSNEAAIVKQGVALKNAIAKVLEITGREKVILMGHSMGGLAAREYLQNSENWQADGKHHVAKLITTGTPHGGYTGNNAGLLTGINSSSEAYRDLRKEFSNGSEGLYLYGGNENSDVISGNFYNNDVNCNGTNNDNTSIIGLNDKNLYADVDYAYIIGICTNCFVLQGIIEGDGIVRSENANLDFYDIPEPRNKYIYTAAASNGVIGLHSDLPKAIYPNLQGLDEPNEYWLSYAIDFNKLYNGYITMQPENGYAFDYDDYKFNVANASQINFYVFNPLPENIVSRIVDNEFNVIDSINLNSGNNNFLRSLPAGEYYLEIVSEPTATSYFAPYRLSIETNLNAIDFVENKVLIYPNPTSEKINIVSNILYDHIDLYNVIGQKVMSIENGEKDIDFTSLIPGTYILKLINGNDSHITKIIKQ